MGAPGFPSEVLEEMRELVDDLVMALDHEPAPADAEHVELVALDLQAPFALADGPPELVRELAVALGRRGDPVAADLLVAMERLAPEPLAGFAAEQRAQLQRAGIVAPHERQVGAAALVEAFVFPLSEDSVEVWLAVVRRPDSELSQAVVVLVAREPCGAVINHVFVTEPEEDSGPEAVLPHLSDRPAERLPAGELLRRLRVALAHMERHGVALDSEAARVLPLLERALTGCAGRLPTPKVEFTDEEAELYELADGLVEAFAEALDHDEQASPALREGGPFVAHCMLTWKLDYVDGRVERWTLGDLRELLLDWFPRKVTADDETIEIAGDAVKGFLRFLGDERLLDAPVPLASLEAAVERLRPRFERACRDVRRWDPADSLVAEMAAEGVDLGDEHAVDAWIERYDARAFDGCPPAPARASAAKREKRKATRQARRRNRR